jgi:HlyD family secretion protein
VADLTVDEGQYVGQGKEICTLLRDARMKVEVDVLESDLVDVREGATARVHVPALGPEDDPAAVFEGTVWAINPQVRPESGTGRVTVSVPNPSRRLVAGLFANVRLETERLSGRLVVPDEAVLVRQGRDLVFVVEDGRAQWTYVTVGARSGDYVEITKGVAPGDTVAVDGHFALAHDAPVQVDEVREVGLE